MGLYLSLISFFGLKTIRSILTLIWVGEGVVPLRPFPHPPFSVGFHLITQKR